MTAAACNSVDNLWQTNEYKFNSHSCDPSRPVYTILQRINNRKTFLKTKRTATHVEKAAPREKKNVPQTAASNRHWVKRCAHLSSHSLADSTVVPKFIWGHLLSYASHPITVKGWVMIAGSDPRWNRGGFHKPPACWYCRGKKDGSVAGCAACGINLLGLKNG